MKIHKVDKIGDIFATSGMSQQFPLVITYVRHEKYAEDNRSAYNDDIMNDNEFF